MASIYQTTNRGEASLRVYITPRREEADLWVYSPTLRGQADSDSLWYITTNRHKASQLCYFGSRAEAQLIVHFVESVGEAGWRRPHQLKGKL